ncbi:4-oxalomesaconate tautomerase [Halomonas sp. H33-56]|uniref:4-oxalomesaconate tautomerase n=2 Tax=Halomonas TaxID=2745 RepID=A0AAU7KL26_9GAMM|nr:MULTISPECIES: 4-oxalomesaconate tautomerase [unclassified Halomonas]MAR71732.1 4-oxalomesaconate tautomerase [Halomonas sp.]MBR9880615.1 4-oxalomesaconate tautomerase [Gammaproteobacteria bacterium]MBY5941477.1 4-oxalomesaconate tautomerase [Halomonas sp. DP5N14-9]RQW72434.1 4-oxalomesaconate tautomerase [Halomonas sp. YLB-10]
MMNSIPCMIMRGGTSRGPFLRMSDLPDDEPARAEILISLMGSGHALQIDGIGGGDPLTSKVAIVERSSHPDADVDYLFAQVDVLNRRVDFNPNCGNMLSAVGPYAIESGLVEPQPDYTLVRVRNLNTQRLIECHVPTDAGQVRYDGDTRISGVPGSSAAIQLSFLDIVGTKTSGLLPTGQAADTIDGVTVSCLDAATPIIMIDARELGLSGRETPLELDADSDLLKRLERIRRHAGELMGLGDVSDSVLPKPVLASPAEDAERTLCTRYFVPHRCHKAIAVTGAIAVASAVSVPGTVANRIAIDAGQLKAGDLKAAVSLEHPSGFIDLQVEHRDGDPGDIARASLIRTARKIMSGTLFYALPDPTLPGTPSSRPGPD